MPIAERRDAGRVDVAKVQIHSSVFRIEKMLHCYHSHTLKCDDDFEVIKPQLPALRASLFRHYRPATVIADGWAFSELAGFMPESIRGAWITRDSENLSTFLTALPRLEVVRASCLSQNFFDHPVAAQLDNISYSSLSTCFGANLDTFLLEARFSEFSVLNTPSGITLYGLKMFLKAWNAGEREFERVSFIVRYNPNYSTVAEIFVGLNVVEEKQSGNLRQGKLCRDLDGQELPFHTRVTRDPTSDVLQISLGERLHLQRAVKAAFRFNLND